MFADAVVNEIKQPLNMCLLIRRQQDQSKHYDTVKTFMKHMQGTQFQTEQPEINSLQPET